MLPTVVAVPFVAYVAGEFIPPAPPVPMLMAYEPVAREYEAEV
jgi:hypothetical protein